eukprot:gene7433-15201_t
MNEIIWDMYFYASILGVMLCLLGLLVKSTSPTEDQNIPSACNLQYSFVSFVASSIILLPICAQLSLERAFRLFESTSSDIRKSIISEAIFFVTFLWCLQTILRQIVSVKFIDEDEKKIGKITTLMVMLISSYTLYSICSGGSWLFDNKSFLNMKIKDMKGTVARYLSHQLRTPINTVTLALHCLKSQVNTNEVCAEGTELVDDAITAVSAVTTVLENIITYESLSASTLKMYPRMVYPADYIKDTLRLHFDIAKQKSIGFEVKSDTLVDVDTNAVCISIDSIRFSQVINTLVGNAIKYTKKGGKVTVSVEYCHLEKDHNHNGKSDNGNDYSAVIQGSRINASGMLKIRVTDTGRGIAKETLPGLFERSLRFNPGLEEKDQGSGISLWITRRLVDLHRYCTLEVESEGVGRGTEFVLSIPFYEQPEKLFVPLCRNSLKDSGNSFLEEESEKEDDEDDESKDGSVYRTSLHSHSGKISMRSILVNDTSRRYELRSSSNSIKMNTDDASKISRSSLSRSSGNSGHILNRSFMRSQSGKIQVHNRDDTNSIKISEIVRGKEKFKRNYSMRASMGCNEDSIRSKSTMTTAYSHNMPNSKVEDIEIDNNIAINVLIVDDAPMTLKMIVR